MDRCVGLRCLVLPGRWRTSARPVCCSAARWRRPGITQALLLAPLVVIAGPVLKWARAELASAVAIVTSGFALLITLAFTGSDIAQRADDARETRVYGGLTDMWRDEAARYDYLSVTVFANPLRRG